MSWFGKKSRPISINRMVNIREIKENLSFSEKLSYWWFFRNV